MADGPAIPPDRGSAPARAAAGTACLPLAIAALDVAGQVRERSPSDSAIFGAGAGRLADRFTDPDAAQELLARAVGDGAAEGCHWLVTGAGPRPFQVSLWRQRGGDRIRILAAFAASAREAAADRPRAQASGNPPALVRLSQDLRSPLAAAMGFAEKIRSEAEGTGNGQDAAAEHAGSIVAAAWRLAAIVDDLEQALRDTGGAPGPRTGEVDLDRLVRRVARLARPAAEVAEGTVTRTEASAAGISVLGDEGMIWSIVDTLTHCALRTGGAVSLAMRRDDGSLVLEIADGGAGLSSEALAAALADDAPGRGLGYCRRMARANGAELEVGAVEGRGTVARLVFPPARVLDLA